jgi:ABC-2 type transport system ATP-binding protein
MNNILDIRNVSKTFVNHQALTDVSFSVPEQSVYGLLGPNGAGKTTLIRIISHITAPDSGVVLFDGKPITAKDTAYFGYLPEERGLYKKMKVGEQAMYFAQLKGLSKNDAKKSLNEWFERLEITAWWDKKVEELSKGMAQKVQFIITVLHKPRLLIFDEPFSGFDPINANILKREILELRDKGATIIFSTHNMSSVEELCEEITLINNSHNILTGNTNQIRQRFGKNRFKFTFQPGSNVNVNSLIEPYVTKIVNQTSEGDYASYEIILKDKSDLKPFINLLNNVTELVSFSPIMPSMDDIFISSVNAFNESRPIMPEPNFTL